MLSWESMSLISKLTEISEREKNLQVLRTIRDTPDSSPKERMEAVVKLERIESGRDLDDENPKEEECQIDLSLLNGDEVKLFQSLIDKITVQPNTPYALHVPF